MVVTSDGRWTEPPGEVELRRPAGRRGPRPAPGHARVGPARLRRLVVGGGPRVRARPGRPGHPGGPDRRAGAGDHGGTRASGLAGARAAIWPTSDRTWSAGCGCGSPERPGRHPDPDPPRRDARGRAALHGQSAVGRGDRRRRHRRAGRPDVLRAALHHPRLPVRRGDRLARRTAARRPGRAVVVHSDLPAAGDLHCSDPMVEQLISNIVWGQRGNYVSVPTDCPQRDERLGWTADTQIFLPTACFHADVAAFFGRWLLDVIDEQDEDGAFGDVAPGVADATAKARRPGATPASPFPSTCGASTATGACSTAATPRCGPGSSTSTGTTPIWSGGTPTATATATGCRSTRTPRATSWPPPTSPGRPASWPRPPPCSGSARTSAQYGALAAGVRRRVQRRVRPARRHHRDRQPDGVPHGAGLGPDPGRPARPRLRAPLPRHRGAGQAPHHRFRRGPAARARC